MMKYVALTKNLKQKIGMKSSSSSSSSKNSPMKRISLSDTVFSENEVDKNDNTTTEDDFFTDTVLNQINKDKKNRTKQMKTFFQKYYNIYLFNRNMKKLKGHNSKLKKHGNNNNEEEEEEEDEEDKRTKMSVIMKVYI